MMERLVVGDDGAYARLPALPTPDFIRIQRDPELLKKQRVMPPRPPKPPANPARLPVPAPAPRLTQPLQRPAQNARPPLYVPDVGISFDAPGFSRGAGGTASRAHPIYPPNAERRGIEGWVRISFTIAEDGRVTDARVVEAEPDGVFERSVLRAVSKWRYPPRTIDGQPIRRTGVEVTVEFRLQDR